MKHLNECFYTILKPNSLPIFGNNFPIFGLTGFPSAPNLAQQMYNGTTFSPGFTAQLHGFFPGCVTAVDAENRRMNQITKNPPRNYRFYRILMKLY